MAGKGDKRRPRDNRYCTRAQWESNYERIFGRKPLKNGEVRAEHWNGSFEVIELGKTK